MNRKEASLLIELARLLDRHGIKSIKGLLASLSSPDFGKNFDNMLEIIRDEVRDSAARPQKVRSTNVNRRIGSDPLPAAEIPLIAVDGLSELAKEKVYWVIEGMRSGSLLSNLSDVRAFVSEVMHQKSKIRTCQEGHRLILRWITSLPERTIIEIPDIIRRYSSVGNRSSGLEEWSSLILGPMKRNS